MTKLIGLIGGMAAALQVPEARVRTAAAQLRKHGLIRSGPRGPGGLEMIPTDAVNLLLALMYDDDLASCHLSVERLRAARFVASDKHVYMQQRQHGQELPPHRFLSTLADAAEPEGECSGEPAPLGLVLDTILDWECRHGTIEEGPEEEPEDLGVEGDPPHPAFGRYVSNFSFEVAGPGHRCKLHLDAHHIIWDVHYRWVSPEEEAYEAAHGGDRFRTRFDVLRGPYMSTSRSIADDNLSAIADVLRGYALADCHDDLPELAVAYDRGAGA